MKRDNSLFCFLESRKAKGKPQLFDPWKLDRIFRGLTRLRLESKNSTQKGCYIITQSECLLYSIWSGISRFLLLFVRWLRLCDGAWIGQRWPLMILDGSMNLQVLEHEKYSVERTESMQWSTHDFVCYAIRWAYKHKRIMVKKC